MQKINSGMELRAAILLLESKLTDESKLLKKDVLLAYESIKPLNLIKSTFKEVSQSQDIKDNLVNIGVGMAAGAVSKVLFERFSNSPMKNLLGTVLMFGIANVITKKPVVAKNVSELILSLVKDKMSNNAIEVARINDKVAST